MKKAKASLIKQKAQEFCKHHKMPYTKTIYRTLKKMWVANPVDRELFFK